jgi:hypothetical protein
MLKTKTPSWNLVSQGEEITQTNSKAQEEKSIECVPSIGIDGKG